MIAYIPGLDCTIAAKVLHAWSQNAKQVLHSLKAKGASTNAGWNHCLDGGLQLERSHRFLHTSDKTPVKAVGLWQSPEICHDGACPLAAVICFVVKVLSIELSCLIPAEAMVDMHQPLLRKSSNLQAPCKTTRAR